MPVEQIEAFIARKSSIITKRLHTLQQIDYQPKTFSQGELFLYLGKLYPLCYDATATLPVVLGESLCLSEKHRHHPQKLLHAWYQSEAVKVFNSRLNYWYGQMGIQPKAVKLSNATTKWGSCTGKGNIHLCWNLIMAPLDVIDYVIVHELAHLVQLNHSAAFWSKVAEFLPDYQIHKHWLRVHGRELRW
jgi:predicted metal-dependent hydrolase